MGLDNIPHVYACRKQGTVIESPRLDKDGNPLTEEDGTVLMTIDCEATQQAGGCPWKNDYEKSGLGEEGRVYGIFGTDCWYRGKYGNFLVEEMGLYNETEGLSFYGALGDNSHKSPHECNILADAMESWLKQGDPLMLGEDDATKDAHYAVWYLRWSALVCEGLDCWY